MPIILSCTNNKRQNETLGVYNSKEEVAARIKSDNPYDFCHYYILTSWEETVILAKYDEVDYEKISDNKYLCIPRLKRKWCENEEEMREFEQFDQGREEREQRRSDIVEMVQGDEAKLFGDLTLNAIQKWLRANNLHNITFYGKDEGGGGSFQKTGRDEPIFFRNKEELFRKYNEQENHPLPRNGPCDRPTV